MEAFEEQPKYMANAIFEMLAGHEARLLAKWDEFAVTLERSFIEGRKLQPHLADAPPLGMSPKPFVTVQVPNVHTFGDVRNPESNASFMPTHQSINMRPSENAKNLALELTSTAEKQKKHRLKLHMPTLTASIGSHSKVSRSGARSETVSSTSASMFSSVNSPSAASRAVKNFGRAVSTPWWRGSQKPSDFQKHDSLVLSKGWGKQLLEPWLESLFDFSWAREFIEPLSKSAREESHRRKTPLQKFLLSSRFDFISGLMIVLYATLLTYHIEYMCKHNTKTLPMWITVSQMAFTGYFCIEVILRVWAEPLGFWFSKDYKWNLFDVVVVSISIFEIILNVATSGAEEASSFALVRVLRILRVVRAIRLIRIFRFFKELRMMVHSSLKSLKPFFWAIGLMLMLIFMFGMQITQVAVEHSVDNPGLNLTELNSYFGSLDTSIYTLFQSVSGGVSWREAAAPLLAIHWSYAVWMSFFVSFTVFAVLNIVTGIFVNSAMQSAQTDQDIVIQDEMMQEDSYANEVLRIFMEADSDQAGYLDLPKLEMHLKDHRVRAYLRHMGLDIDEAVGLFRLLDLGGTGKVSDKDFLLGCMRLKGPAKNVDIATLLYENKRMVELWSNFMSYVEQQLECIMLGVERNGTRVARSTPDNHFVAEIDSEKTASI